jgi:hypothetical protein
MLVAQPCPERVDPLSESNFKIKAPSLHWQRFQVAEAPQVAGDQVGFETESARGKEFWDTWSQVSLRERQA